MKESNQYAIAFIVYGIITTAIISVEPNNKYLIGHILLLVWFLTNYIINEIKNK